MTFSMNSRWISRFAGSMLMLNMSGRTFSVMCRSKSSSRTCRMKGRASTLPQKTRGIRPPPNLGSGRARESTSAM